MVLTAYLRALPGDRALLSPSSRAVFCTKLDAGVEASGPHDFAVRENAVRLSASPRPSHPCPTFVTTAKRPSFGQERRYYDFDLGLRQNEYFFAPIWTASISLKRLLKLVFACKSTGGRFGAYAHKISQGHQIYRPNFVRIAPTQYPSSGITTANTARIAKNRPRLFGSCFSGIGLLPLSRTSPNVANQGSPSLRTTKNPISAPRHRPKRKIIANATVAAGR
jgi:hypothetical protein